MPKSSLQIEIKNVKHFFFFFFFLCFFVNFQEFHMIKFGKTWDDKIPAMDFVLCYSFMGYFYTARDNQPREGSLFFGLLRPDQLNFAALIFQINFGSVTGVRFGDEQGRSYKAVVASADQFESRKGNGNGRDAIKKKINLGAYKCSHASEDGP